jgi:competence protein ComEC
VVGYGGFRVFLSGDSEREELSWWLAHDDVSRITVLKAPHHGSDNGYTPAFLDATRPDVVVISVGPNSYGHPMPEALAAYGSIARRVYRTDRDGNVTILGYRDGHFQVTTGRDGAGVVVRPSRSSPRPSERAGGAHAGRIASAEGAPAEGPSAESHIRISVFANAPGNDHENLNGEYVTLANPTDRDILLAGWTLCDAARHCFRFPGDAVLRAMRRVIVYTGSGAPDAVHFFMGSRRAVWNNHGDTATLYDAKGRVAGRYAYD